MTDSSYTKGHVENFAAMMWNTSFDVSDCASYGNTDDKPSRLELLTAYYAQRTSDVVQQQFDVTGSSLFLRDYVENKPAQTKEAKETGLCVGLELDIMRWLIAD